VKFLAKRNRDESGKRGIMALHLGNHGAPLTFVQEELRPRRLMLQTGSEGRKQSTSKTHYSASVYSTSAGEQNRSMRRRAVICFNYCVNLKVKD
jgi:hypothetical protein